MNRKAKMKRKFTWLEGLFILFATLLCIYTIAGDAIGQSSGSAQNAPTPWKVVTNGDTLKYIDGTDTLKFIHESSGRWTLIAPEAVRFDSALIKKLLFVFGVDTLFLTSEAGSDGQVLHISQTGDSVYWDTDDGAGGGTIDSGIIDFGSAVYKSTSDKAWSMKAGTGISFTTPTDSSGIDTFTISSSGSARWVDNGTADSVVLIGISDTLAAMADTGVYTSIETENLGGFLFLDRVSIDGQEDSVQFRIQAAAGQTEEVVRVEMSDGSEVFSIHADGASHFTHTSTQDDEFSVLFNANAAGFGGMKAIDIDYVTGNTIATEEGVGVLINFDENAATGGNFTGFEVLTTTTGGATVHGLAAGVGVIPIIQESGTFGNLTFAEKRGAGAYIDWVTNANTTVTDEDLWIADNDSVFIGFATTFEELEWILATVATKDMMFNFSYSTGVDTWTSFSPIDGTNGAINNGIMAWDRADLAGWSSESVDGDAAFWVVIVRTRNTATGPTEDLVQISDPINYEWDENGNIIANSFRLEGTEDAFEHIITGVDATADRTFTFPNDELADLDLLIGTGAGTFGYVAMSGGATMTNGGVVTVVDDLHNHVITNIDAFTETQLETQLSDVTALFTNNVTGDVFVSGATSTIGSAKLEFGMVDNSLTLAGNPGMASGEAWFGTTGLIFEGSAPDAFEGLLTTVDITTPDKTWTLPNATGTIQITGVAIGEADIPDHTGDVTGGTALTIAANAVESTMIGANQVNDLDINFGTGTDQLNIIDIPSPTTWSTVYWNATVPVALALGASGLVLKSNGAAAAPTWQADATGSGPWAVGGVAAGLDSTAVQVDADNDTTLIVRDNDAGAVELIIGADQVSLTIGGPGLTTTDSIAGVRFKMDTLEIEGILFDGLQGNNLTVSSNVLAVSVLDTTTTTVNHTQWDEFIKDQVGDMVTGNTETGIAVTYQDADNTMDFVVSVNGGSSAEIVDNTVTMADDMNTFTKAELETQTTDVANFAEADGDVFTGVHDFGGATSIELPNATNPATTIGGHLAYDTDDSSLEVFDGVRSVQMPTHFTEAILIPFPDLLTDTMPLWTADSATMQAGFTITHASIITSVDGAYTFELFEFTSADPPVRVGAGAIGGLIVAAADQRADTVTFTDATIAAGNEIYMLTPSTDIEWIKVEIRYFILGND